MLDDLAHHRGKKTQSQAVHVGGKVGVAPRTVITYSYSQKVEWEAKRPHRMLELGIATYQVFSTSSSFIAHHHSQKCERGANQRSGSWWCALAQAPTPPMPAT